MTTQTTLQPENTTRLKYTGANVGAITLISPTTGQSYAAGNNPADRYQFVHPDDVDWLKARNFVDAPVEQPAPTSTPPTDKALADGLNTLDLVNNDAPVVITHWTDGLGLTDAAVKALRDAGIPSLAAAHAMSDAELDAIPGVGDATIKKLREAGA